MRLNREAEECVSGVKEKIYKRTSVSSTKFRQKMRMEVDTSDYTTGGVLSIECEDGQRRPVAYFSKSHNRTERNYEIHDKEMLAVIRGL